MNTIETKRTYCGRTAYQWLKAASVGESRAGLGEVFADGHILDVTEDGDMVVASYGEVAVLSASSRTISKLRELIGKAGK